MTWFKKWYGAFQSQIYVWSVSKPALDKADKEKEKICDNNFYHQENCNACINELASDFIASSSLKAIQKQKKQFQITQLND